MAIFVANKNEKVATVNDGPTGDTLIGYKVYNGDFGYEEAYIFSRAPINATHGLVDSSIEAVSFQANVKDLKFHIDSQVVLVSDNTLNNRIIATINLSLLRSTILKFWDGGMRIEFDKDKTSSNYLGFNFLDDNGNAILKTTGYESNLSFNPSLLSKDWNPNSHSGQNAPSKGGSADNSGFYVSQLSSDYSDSGGGGGGSGSGSGGSDSGGSGSGGSGSGSGGSGSGSGSGGSGSDSGGSDSGGGSGSGSGGSDPINYGNNYILPDGGLDPFANNTKGSTYAKGYDNSHTLNIDGTAGSANNLIIATANNAIYEDTKISDSNNKDADLLVAKTSKNLSGGANGAKISNIETIHLSLDSATASFDGTVIQNTNAAKSNIYLYASKASSLTINNAGDQNYKVLDSNTIKANNKSVTSDPFTNSATTVDINGIGISASSGSATSTTTTLEIGTKVEKVNIKNANASGNFNLNLVSANSATNVEVNIDASSFNSGETLTIGGSKTGNVTISGTSLTPSAMSIKKANAAPTVTVNLATLKDEGNFSKWEIDKLNINTVSASNTSALSGGNNNNFELQWHGTKTFDISTFNPNNKYLSFLGDGNGANNSKDSFTINIANVSGSKLKIDQGPTLESATFNFGKANRLEDLKASGSGTNLTFNFTSSSGNITIDKVQENSSNITINTKNTGNLNLGSGGTWTQNAGNAIINASAANTVTITKWIESAGDATLNLSAATSLTINNWTQSAGKATITAPLASSTNISAWTQSNAATATLNLGTSAASVANTSKLDLGTWTQNATTTGAPTATITANKIGAVELAKLSQSAASGAKALPSFTLNATDASSFTYSDASWFQSGDITLNLPAVTNFKVRNNWHQSAGKATLTLANTATGTVIIDKLNQGVSATSFTLTSNKATKVDITTLNQSAATNSVTVTANEASSMTMSSVTNMGNIKIDLGNAATKVAGTLTLGTWEQSGTATINANKVGAVSLTKLTQNAVSGSKSLPSFSLTASAASTFTGYPTDWTQNGNITLNLPSVNNFSISRWLQSAGVANLTFANTATGTINISRLTQGPSATSFTLTANKATKVDIPTLQQSGTANIVNISATEATSMKMTNVEQSGAIKITAPSAAFSGSSWTQNSGATDLNLKTFSADNWTEKAGTTKISLTGSSFNLKTLTQDSGAGQFSITGNNSTTAINIESITLNGTGLAVTAASAAFSASDFIQNSGTTSLTVKSLEISNDLKISGTKTSFTANATDKIEIAHIDQKASTNLNLNLKATSATDLTLDDIKQEDGTAALTVGGTNAKVKIENASNLYNVNINAGTLSTTIGQNNAGNAMPGDSILTVNAGTLDAYVQIKDGKDMTINATSNAEHNVTFVDKQEGNIIYNGGTGADILTIDTNASGTGGGLSGTISLGGGADNVIVGSTGGSGVFKLLDAAGTLAINFDAHTGDGKNYDSLTLQKGTTTANQLYDFTNVIFSNLERFMPAENNTVILGGKNTYDLTFNGGNLSNKDAVLLFIQIDALTTSVDTSKINAANYSNPNLYFVQSGGTTATTPGTTTGNFTALDNNGAEIKLSSLVDNIFITKQSGSFNADKMLTLTNFNIADHLYVNLTASTMTNFNATATSIKIVNGTPSGNNLTTQLKNMLQDTNVSNAMSTFGANKAVAMRFDDGTGEAVYFYAGNGTATENAAIIKLVGVDATATTINAHSS